MQSDDKVSVGVGSRRSVRTNSSKTARRLQAEARNEAFIASAAALQEKQALDEAEGKIDIID